MRIFTCNYTGAEQAHRSGDLGQRHLRAFPHDALYLDLKADDAARTEAGILTLKNIGDADVPGAIVHAGLCRPQSGP